MNSCEENPTLVSKNIDNIPVSWYYKWSEQFIVFLDRTSSIEEITGKDIVDIYVENW